MLVGMVRYGQARELPRDRSSAASDVYKRRELGNAPCRVLPIESKDYPAKAARPHFSVLNKAKIKTIYKISISHWEASLRECMKRITK